MTSVFEGFAERNEKCYFYYSEVQLTSGLLALFYILLGKFLSERIKTFLETLIINFSTFCHIQDSYSILKHMTVI